MGEEGGSGTGVSKRGELVVGEWGGGGEVRGSGGAQGGNKLRRRKVPCAVRA